ncbi:hypothetical protein OGV56_10425 [Citrobacter sp. Cb002]|uniref:hypothetical protein n=1 Tax=Citrobacter sp. Cb002 TaxID=2985004 RepID=UPI00257BBFC2|nr:hypothetical protein [Citrobacter sp. Cb002]MDM3361272.1 hypothetical protein [Citrobacter sp. Cb002]
MDLRLAEIARASLTAEPIGAFHISDQQVEGTSDYIKDGEWPIDNGVIEVYTAPPAPEPMKDHQIRELVNDLRDIAVEYHGTQQLRERIARTVRSAMLQAGNSPVIGIDLASEPDRALAKLFGVTAPDLPPLEHDNVHYADAAEMEIAALRQRIVELEARKVCVPRISNDEFWLSFNNRIVFREETYRSAVIKSIEAAGIGVKGE